MERFTAVNTRPWTTAFWLIPLLLLALGPSAMSWCISAVSNIVTLPFTGHFAVGDNSYEVFNTELLLIYIVVAVGLNIVALSGLMSIGHGGLFGVGAYTVAILTVSHGWSFWAALPVAAVLAGLLGLLLGLPALRLGLFALVMATLGFAIVVGDLALQWSGLTGGGTGISGVELPHPFATTSGFYWLTAIFAVAAVLVSGVLFRSPYGRQLKASGEKPHAAQALGIDVQRSKLIAFAVSGVFAGVAGGLYASLLSFVEPDSFKTNVSILFLLMVLLGGSGSLVGPIVGAVLLFQIPIEVNQVTHDPGNVSSLIYGGVLLLSVYFFPRGIISAWWWLTGRIRSRGGVKRAERARANIKVAPQPKAETGSGETPLLEVRGLAKTLGGVRAVQDVSFAIHRGQVHAVIGPNGAGKTTLLNIISGFTKPDRGMIALLGRPSTGGPVRRARSGIARTFQVPQLFENMSCIENVMVSADVTKSVGPLSYMLRLPNARREERANYDRARELLSSVGLAEKELDAASTLPPGEQRLLELVRALATEPSLVLMDEPAAGLSSTEIGELEEIIGVMRESGIGVILVEHHIDMVLRLSDVITVVDFGNVIAHGNPETVRADPKVIAAYLGTDGVDVAADPTGDSLANETNGPHSEVRDRS